MERKRGVREKIASGTVSLVIVMLFVQTLIFVVTAERHSLDGAAGYSHDAEAGDTVVDVTTADEIAYKGELNRDFDREELFEADADEKRVNKGSCDYGSDSEGVLFSFDPNTISPDSLVLLGLSRKQAEVVVKYRRNGGYFSVPDDFRKIYVLPDGLFERVADSISINKMELNSAGIDELVRLPGIGEYYATRIVEFREKAGGFTHKSELLQVGGIDSVRFERFSPMVYADACKIKKRSLDSLTYSELNDHPAVGPYLARGIMRLRDQRIEDVITVALLVARKIITAERAVKLSRYFR
jgi:competence ComEA-like helix-hairpin-helix protein